MLAYEWGVETANCLGVGRHAFALYMLTKVGLRQEVDGFPPSTRIKQLQIHFLWTETAKYQ